MKDFFVEQIFSGVLVTAFPFAVIAGLISFLSPCVLPLVPGYLSFAAGFSVSRGKILLGSFLICHWIQRGVCFIWRCIWWAWKYLVGT
jgi:cytochrome c-type biogenesis protein